MVMSSVIEGRSGYSELRLTLSAYVASCSPFQLLRFCSFWNKELG